MYRGIGGRNIPTSIGREPTSWENWGSVNKFTVSKTSIVVDMVSLGLAESSQAENRLDRSLATQPIEVTTASNGNLN